MQETELNAPQTDAISARKRTLEVKVANRTMLLTIVSMVAFIELLILVRPLLK